MRLLADNELSRSRIVLVGPEALSLREFLAQLRAAMRLRPARFLPIPMPLMRAGARIAELSRHSSLDRATLSMLEAGNTGDPATTHTSASMFADNGG